MCGIAGILDLRGEQIPEKGILSRMIAAQLHRGPDGVGYYRAKGIGLAHCRLSIIDLEGGWQPISNEDQTVWVTYNGEIYNYIELRRMLKARGHQFRTGTDTEILVHLYEQVGLPSMLDEVNGQYSFALWDGRSRELYLVRDHVGIHPMHYQTEGPWFRFSSEIKGLLAAADSRPDLDGEALDQLFTFWGPLSGRTLFKGVQEVPPGHYLHVSDRGMTLHKYWDIPYSGNNHDDGRSLASYAEELYSLLDDATRLRLRADVPVGAYLSGGLDSSVTTALTQRHDGHRLKTFSIAFGDSEYDESRYQELLNNSLCTDNTTITVNYSDIADAFEKVIQQTEQPVLRTAPTPLFLLSGLVRKSGYKTVLTGEGSDEFLGGYDIFKEAMIRKFWMRDPASETRARLFERLYPYLPNFASGRAAYLGNYFRLPSPGWNELFSSHWARWKTTSRIKRFYSPEFTNRLGDYDPVHEIQEKYSSSIKGLDTLSRAQYLEIMTLLPNYLLSSQGDRMSMAHSVEVRFPFLDRRVIEFSCRIPSHYRMMGLNEKAVLKRSMRGKLPDEILKRHKRPYMAPDIKSFIQEDSEFHPVVHRALSEKKVREWGIFNPDMVQALKKKCRSGRTIGFGDSMAFVGILSTHIWLEGFLADDVPREKSVEPAVMKDITVNGGHNGQHLE